MKERFSLVDLQLSEPSQSILKEKERKKKMWCYFNSCETATMIKRTGSHKTVSYTLLIVCKSREKNIMGILNVYHLQKTETLSKEV